MFQSMPAQIEDKAISSKESLYFYTINYKSYEESLCKTEMKYLFNFVPDTKHFFSHSYVEPSRSAFIKQCISIIYTADSLDGMVQQILTNNLSYEKFKVFYINLEDSSVPFDERRKIEYIIGYNINGLADIHNPEILLGITRAEGKWVLGELKNNYSTWKKHNSKPYYYCNALDVRTARALVNIASGNNPDIKLVDPCCGIGTVIMEALSMGLNIKGFELNPFIAENANKNLAYFNYEQVVENKDMLTVCESFDSAIVDIPYGLFSLTTLKQQMDIMKAVRKIAKRAVFVTLENMEQHLQECGFTIVDRCTVSKSNFKRYVDICI